MPAVRVAATIESMVRAPWTYELPPSGTAAENLDDYEARAAGGEHVGVVTGLVERDGELYVLVDAGPLPPFVHRRLAFRWADVAEVDHDSLVVRLSAGRDRLGETALALDPEKARHGPGAEAARVPFLPRGAARRVVAGSAGPVDSASAAVGYVLMILSPLTAFLVVVIWSTRGLAGPEYAVFAVPALFALLALAVAGYRLYREPHRGRHAPGRRTRAVPS
jgi:hypothetical protein